MDVREKVLAVIDSWEPRERRRRWSLWVALLEGARTGLERDNPDSPQLPRIVAVLEALGEVYDML